jgi:hypothetical protein
MRRRCPNGLGCSRPVGAERSAQPTRAPYYDGRRSRFANSKPNDVNPVAALAAGLLRSRICCAFLTCGHSEEVPMGSIGVRRAGIGPSIAVLAPAATWRAADITARRGMSTNETGDGNGSTRARPCNG